MALFSFFKGAKNRKFDYIPRYYNPEKEKLEEALGKYQPKEKTSLDDLKMNIKAGLKMRSHTNKTYNTRSNLIIFAVIIVLILLTFYMLSAYLPLLLGMEGGNP
jgi:hypothetical protein